MKVNRNRLIVISLMSILLASALIVTSSYSLYSNLISINTHISSGYQIVGFKKIGEKGKIIDPKTGMIKDYYLNDIIDLTLDNQKVFIIENFIPGTYVYYSFQIENLGTATFDYYFAFTFDQIKEIENREDTIKLNNYQLLMKQLNIRIVKQEITVYSNSLLEYYRARDDNKLVKINSLNKKQKDYVDIKIDFIDDDKNNYVQNLSLAFDLNLSAVQKIEEK